jgi:hypothetical protein
MAERFDAETLVSTIVNETHVAHSRPLRSLHSSTTIFDDEPISSFSRFVSVWQCARTQQRGLPMCVSSRAVAGSLDLPFARHASSESWHPTKVIT